MPNQDVVIKGSWKITTEFTFDQNATFTVIKTFEELTSEKIPQNFNMSYTVKHLLDGKEHASQESGTVTFTGNGNTYTGTIQTTVWKWRGTQDLTQQERYKTVIELKESNANVPGYTHEFQPVYSADATVSGSTATFRIDGTTFEKTLSLKNVYTAETPSDDGKGITVTKTRTSIKDSTGANVDEENIKPGDVITWTITVTNLSNVEKGVTLTDTLHIGEGTENITLDQSSVTLAPAGQEGAVKEVYATYMVKDTDVGETITNSVTASTSKTGEDKTASDNGTKIPKPVVDDGRGIEVNKVRESINDDTTKATAAPGDTIKWKITVTNKSNVKKTVTLNDTLSNGGKVTLTAGPVTLEPAGQNGSEKVVYATYMVGESDVGTTIRNSVTASTGKTGEDKTAGDQGTDIINKPVTDNGAGITVEKKRSSITRDGKEVDPKNIQVGDTINWDITVTNKSNVKKTVTLTDELTIGTAKQYLALYPNTVELAPAGEEDDSQIVTVSYTVCASDVGKTIKNAVQATTGGEGDKENPKADDGDGTKIPDPIEISKTRTSVTRDGKTVDVKDIQVGDRINYAITVKNNTNLALTSLKLVEGNGKFVTSWAGVKFEETSLENVIIPAGGESTFEAFHEVTAADLDTFVINTVTAILDGMEFKASDDGTKIPSLKIKVDNVTVTYDGEGHGIQVEANVDCAVTYTDKRGNTIEGLPTDAGEYTATVTYRDGDKTMTVTGKVTIKKAELTITTASAKKYYDGKALTKDAYEVKGLVNGETVKATVTGSQTKVGSSANTCTIEWADGTTSVTRMAREAAPTAKQSNYTLNANLGTLTVKRASSGGGWDNVPKTGDSGVTAIFSSLLFLALAGTACAWVYDRKRTRR